MRRFALVAAVAALSACSQGQEAEQVAPADEAVADANSIEATPAAMSLSGTSWEFTREGVSYIESIDENGNYIAETADGKHADHGQFAMKDGKACFTSAMTGEGEDCWTVADTQIGETTTTTNDKGETLEVTRVEYRPLTMPS